MSPTLSIIVPTRERATYLKSCLRTCLSNDGGDVEFLILDNASADETYQVVTAFDDPRIRYERSNRRLSMRNNFERGLSLARGEFVGFIGDDDGVFPFTVSRTLELFATGVEAVSSARAHYSWPDLELGRRGMGLLPRATGVEYLRSREHLRAVLKDENYYRIPCVYHGFVAKSAIDRVIQRQGRFFTGSIVDIYSAVALGMEDILYAFSASPLVINGGSRRSNGASNLGGGDKSEKARWEVEEDLGYLPGFEGFRTVGALIVESALRFLESHPEYVLQDIFEKSDVLATLLRDAAKRHDTDDPGIAAMFAAVGEPWAGTINDAPHESHRTRIGRNIKAFVAQLPTDLLAAGVSDVYGAMRKMTEILAARKTGFTDGPVAQLSAALRIARN